jgi:hypothetical protein
MYAAGHGAADVAAELLISTRTVRSYLGVVSAKYRALAADRRPDGAIDPAPQPSTGSTGSGGVFINYRSVDDPLGAAAIHDALARQFGADNVFRDSVSLEAGAHYPSAIRAALAKAAVVVSIIGPQWLTLTDAGTGERLIDRTDDWIRTELALAFKAGIPVVPVLLTDTPANATPPRPTELPPDIRSLGLVQSVEVNQRQLGADLERLIRHVQRVTQLRPRPTEADNPAARAALGETGDLPSTRR